ncbi:MAG TPA: hypothetical protein VHD55_01185 [Candidatus Paceibacterota bacterium]|nr:hypothetical protein [Candidatus Paceibacterota bacterium]
MKKLLIAAVLVLAAAACAYFVFFRAAPASPEPQLPPYTVPALSKDYKNSTYNFSLKMPADFDATDIPGDPDGTPNTIVLQDKQGNGIQITVSPFDEDTGSGYTLTQERIQTDVPDLTILDPQVLEVGNNYNGLAFKSDNEAFGGASREVWFVFRGNLYQISTYDRLDGLLKQIFQTWQFL